MRNIFSFSLFEALLADLGDDAMSSGGWILILGKRQEDETCSLYAAQIRSKKALGKKTDEMGNTRKSYSVSFQRDNYHIIKQIETEGSPVFVAKKIGGGDKVLEVMGLLKDSLVLNSKNKTPFWWITSKYTNLNLLLRECSLLIGEIPDKYNCVIDEFKE
jgi:hypothetical protein